MTKQLIIQIVVIASLIIFYFIYTLRYFRKFRKEIIFSSAVKTFHSIMIWFVPFFWILILKSLTKTAPGSYEIEEKEDPQPFPKSSYAQGLN